MTNFRNQKRSLESVFIHFGAHKTGTSYLQDLFANNQRFFKRRGSYFTHPQYGNTPAIRALKKWQSTAVPEGSVPDEFTDYLNAFKSHGDSSVCISSESLFGSMDLSRTKTAMYPWAGQVMRHIQEAFNEQVIKVAYSTRNYADFIESSYKWKIRDGMRLSFDEYLDKIDLEKISWVPIIEEMLDTYGLENVMLWEYETYKKDSKQIHLDLLRFFYGDVRNDVLVYPPDTLVNVSANAKHLYTNRKFNQAVASLDFLDGAQKRLLRAKIRPTLDEFFAGSDDERPILLDASTRKKLDTRYKKDVATIEKLYTRPLDRK